MLETLISSKTRIKLLLKFFLNAQSKSYLRNMESEFGESTNSIRLELNKFESAGMLVSSMEGNKKVFQVNQKHPLYTEIHNMVMKYVGFDHIIEKVISKLGNLKSVYVVGDYACGRDSGVIDLILFGENINEVYLMKKIRKAEKLIDRKVRFLIYSSEQELKLQLANQEHLMIWSEPFGSQTNAKVS